MSATNTVTETKTTTIKMPLVLKRLATFWVSFGVALIFNLLLTISVYTFGYSSGYEGTPSFDWGQLASSVGLLFGGFGSLLALIGGLAIVGVTFWFVHWLSKHGHHNLVVVAFAVGVILGGLLLWPLLSTLNVAFGILPIVALFVFTGLEALLIVVILSIQSRKRDTTH